jgi:hypothetical protein
MEVNLFSSVYFRLRHAMHSKSKSVFVKGSINIAVTIVKVKYKRLLQQEERPGGKSPNASFDEQKHLNV